jgi:hypothetical protein
MSACLRVLIAALLIMAMTGAQAYTIPDKQIDRRKIFWGSPTGFEKPGNVEYGTVVKATPEYKEVSKKKVERGSGKYWLLMSRASDRAVHAIIRFGEKSDYDLIAQAGYLGSLDPPIPADNVTNQVLKILKEENAEEAED